MKRILSFATGALALLTPALALADAPANAGAVNVAAQGFEAAAKPVEATDATDASLGAGGLIASGNTNSASLNATARGRLRRGANQAKADVAANYAATKEESNNIETQATSAKNLQGFLRYDHFFSDVVAGYVRASGLYDQVKLIDFRLNLALGAAFYVISHDKEELYFDLGYSPEKTWLHASEIPLHHNARVGAGYSVALNENVAISLVAEYLLALNQITSVAPGCTDAASACSADNKHLNAQLFFGGRLDAKLSDKFSLATSAALRWDGNPPLRGPEDQGTQQLGFYDVTGSLNLVYNLY